MSICKQKREEIQERQRSLLSQRKRSGGEQLQALSDSSEVSRDPSGAKPQSIRELQAVERGTQRPLFAQRKDESGHAEHPVSSAVPVQIAI